MRRLVIATIVSVLGCTGDPPEGAPRSAPLTVSRELATTLTEYFDREEKRFTCAYDVIGLDEVGPRSVAYLWVVCDELGPRGEVLSGSSGPRAVTLLHRDTQYFALGEDQPRDGDLYGPSIEAIFPARYLPSVFADIGDYNLRVYRLERRYTSARAGSFVHGNPANAATSKPRKWSAPMNWTTSATRPSANPTTWTEWGRNPSAALT